MQSLNNQYFIDLDKYYFPDFCSRKVSFCLRKDSNSTGPSFATGLPSDSPSRGTPLPLANDSLSSRLVQDLNLKELGHAWRTKEEAVPFEIASDVLAI